IPATDNDPVIGKGNAAVHDIVVGKGASVLVESVMQVSGSIFSNGRINVTDGTIELNGDEAQTFSGSSFTNSTIQDLIISNKYVSISNEINDTLNITGAVSFSISNATLNTGDNLALKSTENATARIADITNGGKLSGNSIKGKAIVEKYIAARKGWYFLAIPTKPGQNINEA